MPEMSGVEFTTIILGPDRGEVTKPVVVGITAEVSESVDARCRSVGMIDVLHKPITASQMHQFFESMGSKFATQLATQNDKLAPPEL
jgi:CheY-like chemotaxis protein